MYVLLTAAKNEGKYIGQTIQSVVRQTITPVRWFIVNDGSNDETADLVRAAQSSYPWITLVERKSGKRNFASKAEALNLAWHTALGKEERGCSYFQFIGVLDADITLYNDYYEELIKHFDEEGRLGLVGGWIYEWNGKGFRPRPYNSQSSVPGGIQFFRRHLFEKLGGIPLAKHGGEDWLCELLVRHLGFEVRAFKELVVIHNKRSAIGFLSAFSYALREGRMDASVGCLLPYHLARNIKRIAARPMLLVAFLRLAGYLYERAVSPCLLAPDALAFFRKQQKIRLRLAFTAALGARKTAE